MPGAAPSVTSRPSVQSQALRGHTNRKGGSLLLLLAIAMIGVIKLPASLMNNLFRPPSAADNVAGRPAPFLVTLGWFNTTTDLYAPQALQQKGFSLSGAEMRASHTYMRSVFNLCFAGVSFYLYDCL